MQDARRHVGHAGLPRGVTQLLLQFLFAQLRGDSLRNVEIDADQTRPAVRHVRDNGRYGFNVYDAAVRAHDPILSVQLLALTQRDGHCRLGAGAVGRVNQVEPAGQRGTKGLRRLAVELIHGVAPPHRAPVFQQLVHPGARRAGRHTEAN